ncbi:modifier of mdg4-like isoform X26 [Lutzomyia longipalpis]|uniref:modifier of mdg4-like isoform X26 n=1 Tax=Lutzomyia longipalpis TaxID=7200 RepID=UPI0024839237|nr:modifier of mdg4-like isoform X26 [Lutzomyia longipalpis]XP_055695350.1 modifier of mdg4-like isoform X26 [Lutzomyia longipalpis]
MADEELFSLCWNNFNTNLSAGFHESLVNGDLVDVTLAAEGQLVKAHRLVLSVCSPYFRKMFTNMPANQHAFVFLKDVTHSALKELIQFMYCGEVNVKQEALPAFISTAEALQIKGLTDSGESAPPPPSSPTKVATPSHSTASSPPRVRTQQRTVQRTTYKLESEDSADERTLIQVQHTQKRTAPRQTVALQSVPSAKRTKMETHTIETVEQPTETQTTARISEKSEAEFIDLPITETLSAKAEPVEEYAEDTAEDIEQEGEATYVEEDTYGDMKYDESYFTENDDTGTKPNVSGFSDTYTGESDPTVAEAQGLKAVKQEKQEKETFNYIDADIKDDVMHLHSKIYKKYMGRAFRSYWRCINASCGAQLVLSDLKGGSIKVMSEHTPDCTDAIMESIK